MRERERGEEGLDGEKGEVFERSRGGRAVEGFDGVVEGSDAGGEPEGRRGVEGEEGVVDDRLRGMVGLEMIMAGQAGLISVDCTDLGDDLSISHTGLVALLTRVT